MEDIKIERLYAKAIVDGEFWVLTDGKRRIGQISVDSRGYQIYVNGKEHTFKTIDMLKRAANIKFDQIPARAEVDENSVHGYPTDAKQFNGVWSLEQRAPIFTKEDNSKSWFAAGWYLIHQNKIWRQEFCPKLITIQRYKYRGPFKNQRDLLKVTE
jgi:hypothetical protein